MYCGFDVFEEIGVQSRAEVNRKTETRTLLALPELVLHSSSMALVMEEADADEAEEKEENEWVWIRPDRHIFLRGNPATIYQILCRGLFVE